MRTNKRYEIATITDKEIADRMCEALEKAGLDVEAVEKIGNGSSEFTVLVNDAELDDIVEAIECTIEQGCGSGCGGVVEDLLTYFMIDHIDWRVAARGDAKKLAALQQRIPMRSRIEIPEPGETGTLYVQRAMVDKAKSWIARNFGLS